MNAGADIVALDATDRPRPDGRTFAETVRDLRAQCETLVMADCMTIEDIRNAVEVGCDIVSTTLSHNKPAIQTTMDEGPDIALLQGQPMSSRACPSSARAMSIHRPMQRLQRMQAPGP